MPSNIEDTYKVFRQCEYVCEPVSDPSEEKLWGKIDRGRVVLLYVCEYELVSYPFVRMISDRKDIDGVSGWNLRQLHPNCKETGTRCPQ